MSGYRVTRVPRRRPPIEPLGVVVTPLTGWCTCPRPRWRTVTLFGAIELLDVHECALCGRPPRHELSARHVPTDRPQAAAGGRW